MINVDKNKKIHYCWFGNNKKSSLIKKCINSWKKYMPEYEIVEWNEKNFDINCNKYVQEAYKQKKWAFVTDYARLWIIYNFGGIYLDTDVELIKPIDDEYLQNNGFFCMELDKINTGLGFGANKHDKLVLELLKSYNDIDFNTNSTCVILNDVVFKKMFNDFSKITKKTKISGYIIYPNEYFCPLNYITRKMNITNNTVAIHWYSGSWQNKSKKILSKIKIILRRIIGENKFNKLKKILKKQN